VYYFHFEALGTCLIKLQRHALGLGGIANDLNHIGIHEKNLEAGLKQILSQQKVKKLY
jgi:hypothetical protein